MFWVFSTLIATIASGLLAVGVKFSEYYYNYTSTSSAILFFTSVFFIIYSLILKHKFQFNYFSSIAGLFFGSMMYFLFKSIATMSNPGIAMALIRTQVVLTLIAGLFIFKYKLNIVKILSILVLLGGAFMIVLFDKNKNKDKKCKSKKWIIYIILAIILYSGYDVTTKLAVQKIDTHNHTLIAIVFAFIIAFLLELGVDKKIGLIDDKVFSKKDEKYRKYHIISLSLSCVFMILFFIFINRGISDAPRPSYAKAILVFSMVITTIVSKFLIKGSKINPKQWGGMALIVGGILGITLL